MLSSFFGSTKTLFMNNLPLIFNTKLMDSKYLLRRQLVKRNYLGTTRNYQKRKNA